MKRNKDWIRCDEKHKMIISTESDHDIIKKAKSQYIMTYYSHNIYDITLHYYD